MRMLNKILTYIGLGSLATILAAGGLATILFFVFFWGVVGIWLWPYIINTWLVFFGKTAQILWWHGFIIGFVLSLAGIRFLGVVLAVLTWVGMMFLI